MPIKENDPEIVEMLAQLQASRSVHAARIALDRYHVEALAGARNGADRKAKEALVHQARQRLKETLRLLLS